MKKKQLEITLQQVPSFQHPKVRWEQYITPATLAADMLFLAHGFADIAGKTVLDLGCGTGIFAVGAALLGAEKVIAIDIDQTAIDQAQGFADKNNVSISFLVQDISQLSIDADTVLMNPPFGAQKANKHADRAFLEKAITSASVVYSLHLTHTIPFVQKLVHALDAEISVEKPYSFPISALFSFHQKITEKRMVSLIRVVKK